MIPRRTGTLNCQRCGTDIPRGRLNHERRYCDECGAIVKRERQRAHNARRNERRRRARDADRGSPGCRVCEGLAHRRAVPVCRGCGKEYRPLVLEVPAPTPGQWWWL